MPIIPIATLDGMDLPIQFSYRPYVPRKRNSTTVTNRAVVVQYSDPQIIHGDGTISWKIEAGGADDFMNLYAKYSTTSPTEYTFVGYWGETLEVYFNVFDQPEIRGRLFNLSGMFQVVCETVEINAECTM